MTLQTEVSVTASRGTVEDVRKIPHFVSVKDKRGDDSTAAGDDWQRSGGNAWNTDSAEHLWASLPFLEGAYGQSSAESVLDGVRFNNSIYRFGPNQYLALLEPSQVQRVESVLGPTGSQYGSDALGGTINAITLEPEFGLASNYDVHGQFQIFGASADASGGANTLVLGWEQASVLDSWEPRVEDTTT